MRSRSYSCHVSYDIRLWFTKLYNQQQNTDTTITSSITAQDTNVTHADDADNYKTEITGEFSITSTDGSTITQMIPYIP